MGNKENSFKTLWQEIKQYFELNVSYARLTLAEKLAVLLSATACVGVCLLLGIIVLFFLSIAVVHWLALAGLSLALSYTIMAAFNLLIVVLVYVLRKPLIVNPISKFISRLILR